LFLHQELHGVPIQLKGTICLASNHGGSKLVMCN